RSTLLPYTTLFRSQNVHVTGRYGCLVNQQVWVYLIRCGVLEVSVCASVCVCARERPEHSVLSWDHCSSQNNPPVFERILMGGRAHIHTHTQTHTHIHTFPLQKTGIFSQAKR